MAENDPFFALRPALQPPIDPLRLSCCLHSEIETKMKNCQAIAFLVGSILSNAANAFSPVALSSSSYRQPSPSFLKMSDSGSVEQIEFKIFPDGRVEETVRGIKGKNCHQVTADINEALGNVIDTSPTEEMYEQELVVDQTVTNTQQVDGSSSSWDGSSSTW